MFFENEVMKRTWNAIVYYYKMDSRLNKVQPLWGCMLIDDCTAINIRLLRSQTSHSITTFATKVPPEVSTFKRYIPLDRICLAFTSIMLS